MRQRQAGKDRAMQAKDVMTAKVVSVSKDTPVHEVVGLLLKYRISAVPVIDEARQVLGIVSEGDLLRPEGTSHHRARQPWWLTAVLASQGLNYDTLRGRTAGDVMTRDVYSIDEEASLSEIAELLERRHIKRVPVLRNGKLVGIVSRANLLHGLASTIIEHHEPGAAKDRQLRTGLTKLLRDKQELDGVLINVTVRDGNVRLWGTVDNSQEAALAESAAKSLAGVKSVENNLGPGPMSGVPV
jgi:CBS domain-containing protein